MSADGLRVVKNQPGNHKRNTDRANTLSDRHRIPEEWYPLDESDEEVDRGNPNHPKRSQPLRRSTTPIPHQIASMVQNRQSSGSHKLDDTPSNYYGPGLLNPSFGQFLANDITSHVMSTLRDSARMHAIGVHESESEYLDFRLPFLIR